MLSNLVCQIPPSPPPSLPPSLAESKQASVTIELPGAADHPDSAPQPLTIGKISILRHHRLSDVEPLVDCALEEFCHHLHSFSSVQSSKTASSPKVSHAIPRSKENLERGLEYGRGGGGGGGGGAEGKDGLILEAIQRELKLGKEQLVSQSVAYLQQRHRALSYMDLEGASVAGYRVKGISWKRGELRSTGFKNLFSMIGERDTEPLEVYITLKGSFCGPFTPQWKVL